MTGPKLVVPRVAAVVALLIGCSCWQVASPYPDLELDLSRMNLQRLPAGAPSPRFTAEDAVGVIRRANPEEPIEVIRVGRRWAVGFNTTAWVVIYRLPGSPHPWLGEVISDQTNHRLLGFSHGSLRGFGIPEPDWWRRR